jgi:ribosomal protein S18 acetylase RimI-like enzyme
MDIIPSTIEDLPAIMKIMSEAQEYLAKLGIDQWQDGYPQEEIIRLDIASKESFVIKNKLGEVLATTVFTTKTEPTYNYIKGNWITPNISKYGVIHRLAVGNSSRNLGLAKIIFSACESRLKSNGATSLRIDTHEDNIGMQHLIKKMGYVYCGVIYLENGDKRLAFEKLAPKS